MTDERELGQVAYEAYCEQAGGRSLVSGEQLPSWDDQPGKIKRAWAAAARAVLRAERQ